MKRYLIPISICVLSFALFATMICTASAVAQNRATAGVWNGAISLLGTELLVSENLQQKDDGTWSGTIDIPAQNAKGLPLSNIAIETASISFSIAGIPGNPSFKGKLSEDANTISGDYTNAFGKVTFKLTRSATGRPFAFSRPQEPKPPLPYDAVEVSFENRRAGINLAGTLTLPRAPRPSPAAVLITGSRP